MMRQRLFLVAFAAVLATTAVLAQPGSCGATLNLTGGTTSTNAGAGNYNASGPPSGLNCNGALVNSSSTLTISMSNPPFTSSGPFTLFYGVNAAPPLTDLTNAVGIPADCGGAHAIFGVGALNAIIDGIGVVGPPNILGTIAPGGNFSMTFNIGPTVSPGTFVNFQAAALMPGLVVTNAATFTVGAGSTAVVTTQSHADDDSVLYAFQCGNSVNFYGTNYTSVYVNSNGNLTFATTDFNYTESSALFLSGPPRIAQYWDDRYYPTVVISDSPGHLQFKYNNCGWFCNGSFSTEQIDIFFGAGGVSPTIQLSYLGGQGPSCGTGPIVGISPGLGGSVATSIDLTASSPLVGAANAAIYENFNTIGNGFDLTSTATFTANDGLGTTWTMTVP